MAGRFGRFFGNLASNAGGYAVGTAFSDGVRPIVQEEINAANALHPAVPLSAQMAAAGEIVGAYTAGEARTEAAQTGIGKTRAEVLRALAGNAPGVNQLLALWNRHAITEAEVTKGLRQNMIRPEWLDDVKQLRWQLPTAQDLATMAVQGVLTQADARALAALAGTDAETFDRYYRVAGDPIAPEEALTLWNRGDLAEADVDRALRQSRLKPEWVDPFKKLRRYLLPASDVIRLAVHEVYDPAKRARLDLDAEFPDAFLTRSRQLGISDADAHDLWAGHWDLPSYTQAAQMMFRGAITEAEFEGLLAAQDYAPTWRKPLAAIAKAIPGLSDMIRFSVREVYNPPERARLKLDADYPAEFTTQAAKHGLAEADAHDYWAAHWQLPSATQGYHMLWRGEIDQGQLDALLKALDYSPTWRDKLSNIAHVVPGRIDLKRLYAAGRYSRPQLIEGYKRIGYAQGDAEDMAALAVAGSGEKTKDLTAAQLAGEYLGLHIDRAAYLSALDALGYSAEEAEALAALADSKRVTRAREQFVNRIHAQFVGHKVDAPAARAALTDAKVTPAAIDLIMVEWEHEKAVNVRRMTQAQIIKAYKKGGLTIELAHDALTDQGLPDAEATLLLGIA